jgi:hypothetical protein
MKQKRKQERKNMKTSKTGYCKEWGSKYSARRVMGLTQEEKQAVKDGEMVIIENCPPSINGKAGSTNRRVIYKNGNYYARTIEE